MSEKEIKKEKKEMLEFGKYLTDSLKEVDDYFYEDNKNSEEKGFSYHYCSINDFDIGDHKKCIIIVLDVIVKM